METDVNAKHKKFEVEVEAELSNYPSKRPFFPLLVCLDLVLAVTVVNICDGVTI